MLQPLALQHSANDLQNLSGLSANGPPGPSPECLQKAQDNQILQDFLFQMQHQHQPPPPVFMAAAPPPPPLPPQQQFRPPFADQTMDGWQLNAPPPPPPHKAMPACIGPPAAARLPPMPVAMQVPLNEDDAVRVSMDIAIEEDPYSDCPPPVSCFADLAGQMPEEAVQNLASRGIHKPMPIQAQAWPLVLSGRDVIALAQTGSGKTLAFLMPIPAYIKRLASSGQAKKSWSANPVALILAPTRELAVQIADESKQTLGTSGVGLKTIVLYGGTNKYWQKQELRSGADIVVATPGRLVDLADEGWLILGDVSYFVLDEADRMLDLGFQGEVAKIVERIRPEKQLLCFSATWTDSVQELAKGLCSSGRQPVRISYGQAKRKLKIDGSEETKEQPKARESIVQDVVVIDHFGAENRWDVQLKEKEAFLNQHLRTVLEASPENKVLVFVAQKHHANGIAERLVEAGFQADAIHGGKSQDMRLYVLDQFRKGELRLLVCTDVLGRGIDIPSISHVVIYEMGEIEDYVHRIGRTARGEVTTGHALVFFEFWEKKPELAQELITVLEGAKQLVPQKLRDIAADVAAGRRGNQQSDYRGGNGWNWWKSKWNYNDRQWGGSHNSKYNKEEEGKREKEKERERERERTPKRWSSRRRHTDDDSSDS